MVKLVKKDLLKGMSGVVAIILLILPIFFIKDVGAVEGVGYFGYFLSSYFGGSAYILPFIVKLDKKTKFHAKIQNFVESRGVVAVFILAFLPLTQIFYTISAFASGHYKISLKNYFAANFLGKFIRNAIYILVLLYFF